MVNFRQYSLKLTKHLSEMPEINQSTHNSLYSGLKCDNVSDFTRVLSDCVEARRAVIVLENADRLKGMLGLQFQPMREL